ncbi:MAG: response regulator transcription factor [Elusimicrobiota bacterium]
MDDSDDGRKILGDQLKRQGFSVVAASSVDEAIYLAGETRPDLVLSDVAMPEADGMELCRKIRGSRRLTHLPIILISGTRLSEDDQIEGMHLGADDYLPKPYTSRLLAMKIRAVLRRYEAPKKLQETLRCADLELDAAARLVRVKGRPVNLTRKEFDILMLLLRRPGTVHSLRQLLQSVWGDDPCDVTDPHTVQVHLFTLRKKLGKEFGKKIVSVPKLGYRLEL